MQCSSTNSFSIYSTRVSNELGGGRPQAACLATRVGMVLAIAIGVLVGLAMFLGRNLWGYAYSNDTEVVKHISKMMPILAVSFLVDCSVFSQVCN
jgi:MATE family multidrug resistance protein